MVYTYVSKSKEKSSLLQIHVRVNCAQMLPADAISIQIVDVHLKYYDSCNRPNYIITVNPAQPLIETPYIHIIIIVTYNRYNNKNVT